MLQNNLLALFLTFTLSLVWLRLNGFTAHRGWIGSRLSRKIIHIGTGPIFVLCWFFFNDLPAARFLAALVPLAITGQFVLVGIGIIRDESAVKAMSRTGDRREILRGPLFYGIAFVVLTLIYWKDSPIGMVALMLMCGGDGVADLVGRRYGKRRLPWNPSKTLEGSLAVFVGGFFLAALILGAFVIAGIFSGSFTDYLLPVGIVCLVGTLVESLPIKELDNLTITAAAVIAGHLVF